MMTDSGSMLHEMFSLKGKTALITGASGGIGSAMAVAFARAGAVIGVHGRDPELSQQELEVDAIVDPPGFEQLSCEWGHDQAGENASKVVAAGAGASNIKDSSLRSESHNWRRCRARRRTRQSAVDFGTPRSTHW